MQFLFLTILRVSRTTLEVLQNKPYSGDKQSTRLGLKQIFFKECCPESCWNRLFKIDNLLGRSGPSSKELLFLLFFNYLYTRSLSKMVFHTFIIRKLLKAPHLFQSQRETLLRLLV